MVESSWRTNAISHKNAVGLMQITEPVLQDYKTFKGISYSLEDMKCPYKNVEVGAWQIHRLRKQFTNEIKVVSSYNMGAQYAHSNIINLSYACSILGSNRVLSWVSGKKVRPWKGTYRVWYVED